MSRYLPLSRRERGTILAVWAVGALAVLAFWATVIFVAVHFIAKAW